MAFLVFLLKIKTGAVPTGSVLEPLQAEREAAVQCAERHFSLPLSFHPAVFFPRDSLWDRADKQAVTSWAARFLKRATSLKNTVPIYLADRSAHL